ncbi:peptide deformylase [Oleiharenicola lentus]|uniref:peptide deformylase n=1 Tax=Oleiharenicola lentus TaxID=2508720 RepID=UPI003F680A97
MSLKIVHFNNPILRKKGAKITAFTPALKTLAAEMVETMHEANGIGLAAQQIGQDIQLCVLDLRNADPDFDWEYDGAHPPMEIFMPLALVNPEVTIVPEHETVYEEGCLSFPEIRGDVVRPDEIAVKFQDLDGHPHLMRCNGLLSRCVMHEVDHLNGVLFIDHMDKETLASIDADIKALKKATREAAKRA